MISYAGLAEVLGLDALADHPVLVAVGHGRVAGRPAAWQAGWKAIDTWIGTWKMPIAVFASHDVYLSILRDTASVVHGINIPHELSLLGCHNEQVICESPGLSLSSIDLNYPRVGYEAARLLDGLMSGEPAPAGPIIIEPKGLVAWQSTDVTVCDDPLVARTLRYQADNCDRVLLVAAVAEAMGVSLRTLRRQFSRKIGRNIGQELDSFRIERAKRLLRESDEPRRVLAGQCGYSGFKQMFRTFVRMAGMTPTQFRDQHKSR